VWPLDGRAEATGGGDRRQSWSGLREDLDRFLGSGATVHDVTLLNQAVGTRLSIKATGGIRFFEDAVALLEAGASRLGASHTEAVLASRVDRLKVVPPTSY
jgi:deoxyribose-phosphate aldolase